MLTACAAVFIIACMEAVKLVDIEKGLIEGFAIPFGGPMPGNKDLDGEAFSKDTELFLDAYEKRPAAVLPRYGQGSRGRPHRSRG